jgi:hypothetical protein
MTELQKDEKRFNEIEERFDKNLKVLRNCSDDELREIVETQIDLLEDYFIEKGLPFEMAVVICEKFCLNNARDNLQAVLTPEEENPETTAILNDLEIPK